MILGNCTDNRQSQPDSFWFGRHKRLQHIRGDPGIRTRTIVCHSQDQLRRAGDEHRHLNLPLMSCSLDRILEQIHHSCSQAITDADHSSGFRRQSLQSDIMMLKCRRHKFQTVIEQMAKVESRANTVRPPSQRQQSADLGFQQAQLFLHDTQRAIIGT